MRKLATLIMLNLFLVFGAGTTPASAQGGVVTFKFTNAARHIIYMKMFTRSRNLVWPGPNRHFILNDNVERAARLSCHIGDKICFGGSYSANDTPIYWGVGYKGDKACQGCCLVCGTAGQNVTHSWNLYE